MNIIQLCKEAHANAVAKGWWEGDRTYGELIALVHSEVSEALEDHRNGHAPNEVWYEYGSKDVDWHPFPVYNGVLGKPCGIPSELADICIRVFDIAGKYGWGDKLEQCVFVQSHIEEKHESFAEALTGIHHDLSESWINFRHGNPARHLAYVVIAVMYLAKRNNIDLEKAIAEKMAYNATRSHKHGGKVI